MQELLYDSIQYWIILKLLTILGISFLVYKQIIKEGSSLIKNNFFVFFFILTSIFICRFPFLFIREPDGDESEWILYARNLFDDPKFYFEKFNPIQFSRLLTVMPLSVFLIFTTSLKWLHARILSNILWGIFIFINFKTSQKYFTNNKAIISSLFLTIVISLNVENMFIAYNSELPAIVILSLVIYLFTCYYLNNHKFNIYIIALGILIPISNIAKEQTLFLSLILELLIILYLVHIKNFKGLVYLLGSNLITIIIVFIPIALLDKQGDFWQHLELRRNLSYEGWFNEKFNFINHFYRIFIHFSNSIIFLIYSIALLGLLISLKKIQIGFLKYENKNFILSTIFLLGNIACFITYFFTASYFDHQLLYILPFITIQIPFFINLLNKINFKKNVILSLILFLICLFNFYYTRNTTVKHMHQLSFDSKFTFLKSKKLSTSLSLKMKKNDRLIVWGWDNSYYVENELLSGSRYPNIAVLYDKISSKKNRAVFIEKYLFDIKTLRPRFIIEAVGKNEFFTKDQEKFGVNSYPEISKLISSDYILLDNDTYRKLYIRKQ